MSTLRQPLCIGLVAGEQSGDTLGASLMHGIQAHYPDAQFVGVGGEQMTAAGLQSLFPMEQLAVMGIADVVRQLPALLRCRRQVLKAMLAAEPDVFIGIDAPDFNLPIEKKLKAQGIPTVHYVSPTVWAWRPKRIHGIAEATHRVLSILPFEQDFYDRHQVPCTYVGHPMADDIPWETEPADCRAELGLSADGRYVGLLPGSRGSEVGLLSEPFLRAAQLLHQQQPDLEFLVPLVNEAREQQFLAARDQVAPDLPLHIFRGQSRTVIGASDVTMLASGTVSLETMLIKRPMVVCYRFGWLNYQIFRRLVQVAHFSLPNLLHGGELVPELLQEEVTPERLAEEVAVQLTREQTPLYRRFRELHEVLRQGAGEQAARAVLEVIAAQEVAVR